MSKPTSHTIFDQATFEALFKSHFPYLCNFANQYVEDFEAAQDITQKAFITLWEKRSEIDPTLSTKAYLFTIVKNRSLNYIRDNNKYRSKILDIDCGDIEIGKEEDYFAEKELKQKIREALNTLPEKCRKVFEMSRYEEKKYKEIAEELGIAQKTVEAHMSKAIKTLREYLTHYLLILIGWLMFW
ncbi:MAG: RNA polymerase sigma-70 factor [Bacteroidota bacterium]